MLAVLHLFSIFVAASALVASHPTLEARQSPQSLCGSTVVGYLRPGISVWTNTTRIGYLTAPANNGIQFTSDPNQSLNGAYFCGHPTGPNNLVYMGATGSYIPGTQTVGAIGLMSEDPYWQDVGPGSPTFLTLGVTPKTPLGSPPVESGPDTYTYWYESAVWDMEMQQDGRLHIIPYWINPDGYKAQLSFAAVPQLGILTATGDFNEFIKYYPDVKGFPYVQVFLELA